MSVRNFEGFSSDYKADFSSYECSICSDTIVPENTREYVIWHCLDCYNIFHLQCVRTWAQSSGTNFPFQQWKCPCCLVIQEGVPRGTCWCGKASFNFHSIGRDNPNSCLGPCQRIVECPHGNPTEICEKLCHPGPCNSPCTAECPNPEALRPDPVPLRQPNCWQRLRGRFPPRTLVVMFACIVAFMIWIAIICAMVIDHLHSIPLD